MNTPPLLIGAAILFWGWQTGHLIAAVPLALVLEAPRIIRWRMSLTEQDFSRIWKFCAGAFLVIIVIVYLTNRENALRALQWTPVMFFPIVAAQALSTSPRIDSRVFFLWIRMKPFNLGYPYVMLALGAACAAKERTAWFFPVLAVLAGWALWKARPVRASRVLWVVLFVLVSIAGFIGAGYLRELQKTVEDLYIESFQHEIDTSNVRTAIGDIGKRKQSDAIVFRVRDLAGSREPLHLFKTSYDVYQGTSWFATAAPMMTVANAPDGWKMRAGGVPRDTLEVSIPLKAGEGFLVASADAAGISGLNAGSLSVSRLGAIKVDGGPGLATYDILRSKGSFLGPPDENDLAVPKKEDPAVSSIATKLDLLHRNAPAVLDTVKRFFEDQFVYTLDLKIGKENGTPLSDFLLRTRAGHCEYFATAATLLLRKAGIPARYAVGYLAHEYSTREGSFIVRSRDAHAWVLAYVNGTWRTFDSTPPSWIAEEQNSASILEPLTDLWSYVMFRYDRWRWSEGRVGAGGYGRYGVVVLAPVILFLVWKIRNRFLIDGKMAVRKHTVPVQQQGHDSPFFEVEKRLAATEWERRPGETYAVWLTRIDGRQGVETKGLAGALAIHNRYRFDPEGISALERRALEQEVAAWVKEVWGTRLNRRKKTPVL